VRFPAIQGIKGEEKLADLAPQRDLVSTEAVECEGRYRRFFPDSVRIFPTVGGLTRMGPCHFVQGNSSAMSRLTPSKPGDTKNRGDS
jgi:hypothetical protein